MARSSFELVGAFISALNARDLTTMRTLMTDDHMFIDARGAKYFGADLQIENWRQFFYAYPQYWIFIDSSFAYGDRVGLFGEAGGKWRVDGTIVPGSWKVTAAWLAEVQDGKIRSWSIFCDTAWANAPEQNRVPTLAIMEA